MLTRAGGPGGAGASPGVTGHRGRRVSGEGEAGQSEAGLRPKGEEGSRERAWLGMGLS